ncbi:DUF4013 domain-containing protein [bacterium]|nr:DUF4013 domain-containing protein [bacterium]
MSINFSECITAFTSKKYNHSNLAIYLIILLTTLIVSKMLNSMFFDFIIIAVISIFAQGYYVIASHNEGCRAKDIIPNINNAMYIFETGFKFLTGVSTLYIIVFFPCIICFAYLLSQLIAIVIGGENSDSVSNLSDFGNVIFLFFIIFLSAIAGVIMSFKYIIPASLLFFDKLNLKDMLNYKKINEYGYLIKKDYWMYVLFSIIISIIIQTATSAISPLITSLFGFQNTMPQQMSTGISNANQFSNLLFSNLGSITFVLLTSTVITSIFTLLLMPNLNGQVIKNTKIYSKRQEKNIKV